MGVLSNSFNSLSNAYNNAVSAMPDGYSDAFTVIVFAFFIVLVSIFVWQFYKTLSQKDFINLNLKQYNRFMHPTRRKFFAVILYLLENIILMPFFIFLWLSALAIILLLIAQGATVEYLLLLTAALIVAIRFLAYSNAELAKDLSKMFPFIALSLFLLSPSFVGFESVGAKFTEIPNLFDNILFFFLAILAVEVFLKIVSTIAFVVKNKDEEDPWSLDEYGYGSSISDPPRPSE